MENEMYEHFTDLVCKMRKAQKLAFMKSKFEPDKMDCVRYAHSLEKCVDEYLEELRDEKTENN